jgi:hypothetical protein
MISTRESLFASAGKISSYSKLLLRGYQTSYDHGPSLVRDRSRSAKRFKPDSEFNMAGSPKSLSISIKVDTTSPGYEMFQSLQMKHKDLCIYPDRMASKWKYFQLFVNIPFHLCQFAEDKLAQIARSSAPFPIILNEPFMAQPGKHTQVYFKGRSTDLNELDDRIWSYFKDKTFTRPHSVTYNRYDKPLMQLNKSFCHVSSQTDGATIYDDIQTRSMTLNVVALVLKNSGEGFADKLRPEQLGTYRENFTKEFPLN